MPEGRPLARSRQGRNRALGAHVGLVDRHEQESVVETYDPKKSETQVRQGNPRKMNLRVLIVSLVGIVAVFALIYLIYTLTQSNPS